MNKHNPENRAGSKAEPWVVREKKQYKAQANKIIKRTSDLT